jgi:hypothetical protein
MYTYGKMRPVATIPEIKENYGDGEFNYDKL